MTAALAITVAYCAGIWLVFFRMRWLRFSIGWGIISGVVGLHLLLIFLIGIRFVAPASVSAVIVQPTIQLTPRLTQPTVVTEVMVRDGEHVRRGQPLFRFESAVFEAQLASAQAQLAAAQQQVRILYADVTLAEAKVTAARANLAYQEQRARAFTALARDAIAPELRSALYTADEHAAQSALLEAEAAQRRAVLAYESQVNGVNTGVAQAEAALRQARYFLDNTVMAAPADGRIVNLQVEPGMIAGDYRAGAIAALIVDAERYLLATYWQQHLAYVVPGQPVEFALARFPGQVFRGEVAALWDANRNGQFLPSARLPDLAPTRDPQAGPGLYAVRIRLGAERDRFPIGAAGAAAVYTGGGGFAALRKVALRGYSWLNWLVPLS